MISFINAQGARRLAMVRAPGSQARTQSPQKVQPASSNYNSGKPPAPSRRSRYGQPRTQLPQRAQASPKAASRRAQGGRNGALRRSMPSRNRSNRPIELGMWNTDFVPDVRFASRAASVAFLAAVGSGQNHLCVALGEWPQASLDRGQARRHVELMESILGGRLEFRRLRLRSFRRGRRCRWPLPTAWICRRQKSRCSRDRWQ